MFRFEPTLPVRWFAALLACIAGQWLGQAAQAQFRFGGKIAVAAPAAEADVAKDDSSFQGAASLENDPEIERLLHRALQAAEDQRYDLSVVLLQKVLDGASGMLVKRGELALGVSGAHPFELFKSVRDEAEGQLVRLPKEGLHVYRLTADGEAKGLLSGANPDREAALADVVRRFFMSSHGDDAAYELGCLLLDRYDFIAASRLFSKILEDHPDSSVPRAQVLLRLALANARLGDGARAQAAWRELGKNGGGRLPRELVAMVKQELDRPAAIATADAGGSAQWLQPFGNPARTGSMLSPRPDISSGDLAELWGQEFRLPDRASVQQANVYARGRNISVPAQPGGTPLVDRWAKNNWIPAGQMLLEDGRVYIKTCDVRGGALTSQVSCYATVPLPDVGLPAGGLIFETKETRLAFNPMLQQMIVNMGAAVSLGGKPTSPDELAAFGDRLSRAITVSDGVLYVIEGRGPGEANAVEEQVMLPNGMPAPGNRSNFLAAYSAHGSRPIPKPADGGKLLWKRGGDEDKSGGPGEARFAAAPTACAGSLVIPVREGSGLWLYGLAPQDGHSIWKTFLCDEPRGGTSQWLPVGVAVDGGDVYVASGCGVVFSVDGASGSIRWGTRYQRTAGPMPNPQQFGWMGPMLGNLGLGLKGWDEDVTIAAGRVVVVLPSDSEYVYGFDRRTGEPLWVSPKNTDKGDARYCLGVVGDGLYAAGNQSVCRYSIGKGEGRLVFNEALEGPSLGRGFVTPDGLYLPVKDSIEKRDLKTGKLLAKIGVRGGNFVGNLFANGQQLFVAGPSRVSALGPKSSELDSKEASP